jgi:hypothetical protein
MNPNFYHSARSPYCQTQPKPLESEDPPSTSRNVDVCQILLKKIERKIDLTAGCRINGLPTL